MKNEEVVENLQDISSYLEEIVGIARARPLPNWKHYECADGSMICVYFELRVPMGSDFFLKLYECEKQLFTRKHLHLLEEEREGCKVLLVDVCHRNDEFLKKWAA